MKLFSVSILKIEQHTERLLFLSVEKPSNFTFEPGQFVRLGVNGSPGEEPLMRPYSIASAPCENQLDFYIAIVADGEVSKQFLDKKVGDTLYLDSQTYGLMDPQRLLPGKELLCIGTGTGVSAFLSIVKSNPWTRFENITVIHCCRHSQDLSVTEKFLHASQAIGKQEQFRFISDVTQPRQEDKMVELNKRIPQAIDQGDFDNLNISLNPESTRVLLCGNPNFVTETKKLLKSLGFTTPRGKQLGTLLTENFW